MNNITLKESKDFLNKVIDSYSINNSKIPDLKKRITLLNKIKNNLKLHKKTKHIPISLKINDILKDNLIKDKEYLDLIKKCCNVSPWEVGYKNQNDYFNNNFGYCEFIGPNGYYYSKDISCGFVLIGQNLYYPRHLHPAIELYEVICGPIKWEIGNKNIFKIKKNCLIYHKKNEIHSMTTQNHYFLGIFTWIGDINIPPKLF